MPVAGEQCDVALRQTFSSEVCRMRNIVSGLILTSVIGCFDFSSSSVGGR